MKILFSLLALAGFALLASAANYDPAVTALIPRLAAPEVGDRYAAEMELQVITSNASRPGHKADRVACGKVLAAKAADPALPQPARVWLVRQLQYMGGAEAVAALTQLLNGTDAELRECARRALEQNPAPTATTSLRAALRQGGDGPSVIGMINSVGLRRDREAASLLAKHLAAAPTAGPAAWALGRLATPEAVAALWQAFPQVPAAGDALICAADRLSSTGGKSVASDIFRKLYAHAQPAPLRAAAFRGLARVDPVVAGKLIQEALQSDNARLQDAVVAAAAAAPALAGQVTALLPRLSACATAKALAVVNAKALPSVIVLADDTDPGTRLAAIAALGRLGSAAGALVLLKAAGSGDPADRVAAESALASLTDNAALAALEKAAASSDISAQVPALNALAARQQKSALPLMLAAAKNSEAALRKAGLNGLRQMGGDGQFAAVAQLVVATKGEDVNQTLAAMAERVTDKPVAAAKLIALAGLDQQALAAFAGTLAGLGGDPALNALAKLSGSADAECQQSAIEALGSWTTLAAVTPLSSLASAQNSNPQTRSAALAALVNLVKNVETATHDQRLVVARATLNLTHSAADTKLALSALAAVPDAQSATAVKGLLQDADVKREAGATALTMAEALAKTDKAAARDLAQAVKEANISPALNTRAGRLLGK
jgi:hypothetical protein